MNTTHCFHLRPYEFGVRLMDVSTGWAICLTPPGEIYAQVSLFIENADEARAVAVALAHAARCELDIAT